MGDAICLQRRLALVPIVFLFAACTPTVYRQDIAAFSKGVDETSTAFENLHARAFARYKQQRMEDLAKDGAVLGVVSDTCTESVTGRLPRDAACLAQWAAYRAKPEATRGTPPSCVGASESVRSGAYDFYDLKSTAEREAQACRLGIRNADGTVDPVPLDDMEVLLTNTPRLLPALRSYATSLTGIADSADKVALQESVGKAKEQIIALGTRVDALDGKTSPFVSTIGPVSDLLGGLLIAALEQRRYKALVAVTTSADPVVQRAAAMLSNVAMPMTALELQSAGRDYLRNGLPDPGKKTNTVAEWVSGYEAARSARARYLDLFDTSPTPVFKAMANAHHQLVEALKDPSRQYESLKAAIEDFSVKAKAAYDAVQKATKSSEK